MIVSYLEECQGAGGRLPQVTSSQFAGSVPETPRNGPYAHDKMRHRARPLDRAGMSGYLLESVRTWR